MLDLLLCTFLAPQLLGGFALPGACELLKTGLALCHHQRLTSVYYLSPEPVYLGTFSNLDAAAYWNGTLALHFKGEDYVKVGDLELPLPGGDVCFMDFEGGVLLVVGRSWAVAYNVSSLELEWSAGGVSCPADLSPDGRRAAVYSKDLGGVLIIDIKKKVAEGVVKVCSPKDVSLSERGYLVTSCSSSIFNGKKLRFGGYAGLAWEAALLLNKSCKGVMLVTADNKDYCFDLGFTPDGAALVGGALVVNKGGAFILLKPYLPSK
ncbi:hypothetical protein [Ignicoccus hospitalis]|uniref:Uncharacterized protein n=1 Tax=Ignicoccus hospitalis (strain KIN4/I / DSM 18386 / JCM 14125) TaxID=453591 RepID=A8ABV6_IGNH4|nr:hypothetical protein [Ignicoccus hospitalis]ABU82408.1 hypothetical protein Igni_1232 [Ignicoccus hospitalis KIN4/I]HIH90883.1 hypothetical protein [Desulfurococcaceae archaeon]